MDRKHKTIDLLIMAFYLLSAAICLTLAASSFAHARSVTLQWDPSPGVVDGYNEYHKDGAAGGPPYTVKNKLGNVTTYTVEGLQRNRKYFFVVTAWRGTIESGYSNEVSVTMPAGLAPATGVKFGPP